MMLVAAEEAEESKGGDGGEILDPGSWSRRNVN